MPNYFPFLVQLSEKEKKILIAIAIILALIFVFIGLIYQALMKRQEKLSRGIDVYLGEMVKEKIIKTDKQLLKYVRTREFKYLYVNNRWTIRIALITTLVFALFFLIVHSGDFTLAKEAAKALSMKWEWHTTTVFGWLPLPEETFPSLIKKPEPILSFEGILTYALIIFYIVCIVKLLDNVNNYVGRLKRAKDVAIKVFSINLDYYSVHTDAGQQPNQTAPVSQVPAQPAPPAPQEEKKGFKWFK